jgi:hypothetical protein
VSVAIAIAPVLGNDAWCRGVVSQGGAEGCGSGREDALAATSGEELEAGGYVSAERSGIGIRRLHQESSAMIRTWRNVRTPRPWCLDVVEVRKAAQLAWRSSPLTERSALARSAE